MFTKIPQRIRTNDRCRQYFGDEADAFCFAYNSFVQIANKLPTRLRATCEKYVEAGCVCAIVPESEAIRSNFKELSTLQNALFTYVSSVQRQAQQTFEVLEATMKRKGDAIADLNYEDVLADAIDAMYYGQKRRESRINVARDELDTYTVSPEMHNAMTITAIRLKLEECHRKENGDRITKLDYEIGDLCGEIDELHRKIEVIKGIIGELSLLVRGVEMSVSTLQDALHEVQIVGQKAWDEAVYQELLCIVESGSRTICKCATPRWSGQMRFLAEIGCKNTWRLEGFEV